MKNSFCPKLAFFILVVLESNHRINIVYYIIISCSFFTILNPVLMLLPSWLTKLLLFSLLLKTEKVCWLLTIYAVSSSNKLWHVTNEYRTKQICYLLHNPTQQGINVSAMNKKVPSCSQACWATQAAQQHHTNQRSWSLFKINVIHR